MNREEAYKLLVSELQKIQLLGMIEAKDALLRSDKRTVRGEAGLLYTIEVKLVGDRLHGSIHDSNSFKFDLIEESMVIESP